MQWLSSTSKRYLFSLSLIKSNVRVKYSLLRVFSDFIDEYFFACYTVDNQSHLDFKNVTPKITKYPTMCD